MNKKTKLSPEDEQWVKDLLAGKFDNDPIPKLTCLSCNKQFDLDMDTLCCAICKKPICNECAEDMSKLIHHEEQKVRFYDLMTNKPLQDALREKEKQ
jgi:hypothetical protein